MISLKFNCIAGALLIGFLFIPATGAAEIETMGVFSNDSFFDSDGSGVTGSLELVTKTDPWYVGVGIYLVTPELLKEKRPNDDPLAELSRLNLWAGRDVKWFSKSDFHISGRVGLEGGVADDLGFQLQDVAHDLIGKGSRDLESTHGSRGVLGISSWARTNWAGWETGNAIFKIIPYGHASLGSDTIEGGCGLMISVQPGYEIRLPPLLLPKNGSYAPVFGGDGISLYAGARGVAHESLYDGLQQPFIGEFGILGQLTVYGALKIGVGTSCTTKPYAGAIGSDCKFDLRVSYKWSTSNIRFTE